MSLPAVRPMCAAEPSKPVTLAEVDGVARQFLGDVDARLAHVRTAARVARRLAVLFDEGEAELLVAAASLHDIGYAPAIADTGFHPLDGANYLRSQGYPLRLASLVAHHSLAFLNAPHHGIDDLEERFPRESSLLSDALIYADMHSTPSGHLVHAETRLADIELRHTHPGRAERTRLLRAAMTRVGLALLLVEPQGDPHNLTGSQRRLIPVPPARRPSE